MKKSLLLACVIMYGTPSLAQSLTVQEATGFVRRMADKLKPIFSDETSLAVRRHKLRDLFSHVFALKQMGRFVVGVSWRQQPEDLRKAYTKSFNTFVLYKYAKQIGGANFKGEYVVQDASPIGRKDVMVNTQMIKSGAPLHIGWRVRQRKGKKEVIDIVVEKLSMLQAQRASFLSVIQKRGFEGLIKKLDMFNATFLQEEKGLTSSVPAVGAEEVTTPSAPADASQGATAPSSGAEGATSP